MGHTSRPRTEAQLHALAKTVQDMESDVGLFLLSHDFKMAGLPESAAYEPCMGFCLVDYFLYVTGARRIAASAETITALHHCFELYGWRRVRLRDVDTGGQRSVFRKLRVGVDRTALAIRALNEFLESNPTHAALPLEPKYVSRLGFTKDALTALMTGRRECGSQESLQAAIDAHLTQLAWLPVDMSIAWNPVRMYRKVRPVTEVDLAYSVECYLATNPTYYGLRVCAEYEDDLGFTYEQLAHTALRRSSASLTRAEHACLSQVITDFGWVSLRTRDKHGDRVRVYRKLKATNK